MDNYDIVDTLRRNKFIGFFPYGIEVLLVSLPIAISEIEYKWGIVLTNNQLKSLLEEQNVLVFKNPEDYLKWRNPDEYKKQRRKK